MRAKRREQAAVARAVAGAVGKQAAGADGREAGGREAGAATDLGEGLVLVEETADELVVELRRALTHRMIREVLTVRLELLEVAEAPIPPRLPQRAKRNLAKASGVSLRPTCRTAPAHAGSLIDADE